MPLSAAASAREILTGLHEVMAARGSAQAKLDRVVDLIAEAMESEVCSIYLLRDGMLELFATHGLAQGSGPRHPAGDGRGPGRHDRRRRSRSSTSTRRPSIPTSPTGRKPARSGSTASPACRSSAAKAPIGVLAVQHAEPRRYDDVEIEALQTVAMVLSRADRRRRGWSTARAAAALRSAGPLRLSGLKLVAGMASGQAVFHQPRVVDRAYRRRGHRGRARRASMPPSAKMREQIDNMASEAEFGIAGEHQEILETYKMFAYDEGWSRRINEAIDSGLTAEAAIERVQQRTRTRMREIDDPLLAGADARPRGPVEPAAAHRLGADGHRGADRACASDAVLIARNLGPAELLEYDRRRLKGVLLEEGSLTAHMTIVARAMGVPVIGRARTTSATASTKATRSSSTATTAASSSARPGR